MASRVGLVYIFTPLAHIDLPVGVFAPTNSDFFDLKSQNHSFAEMTHFQQAIYNLVWMIAWKGSAAKVDADFFRTLQAATEVGREIDTRDEEPGSERVVVVESVLLPASDLTGQVPYQGFTSPIG